MHDVGMGSSDFYETDEPLEQVLEAFEQGEKRLTAMPPAGQTGRPSGRGWTEYLRLPGALGLLQPLSDRPTSATPRVAH